jgi:murein DD-endopeptidase MepM/ murein hydrolase activator NlpD
LDEDPPWRQFSTPENPILYEEPETEVVEQNAYEGDGSLEGWPVKKWKESGWNTKWGWFGEERDYYDPGNSHRGVDINSNLGGSNDLGAPVYATHDGIVVKEKKYVDHNNSAGTYIILQSKDNYLQTAYMHLDTSYVSKGDTISRGEKIGTVGGSGFQKKLGHAVHLHYEIREREGGEYKSIDPEKKRGVLKNAQDLIDFRGTNSEKAKYSMEIMSKQINEFKKKIKPVEDLVKEGLTSREIDSYYNNQMSTLKELQKSYNHHKNLYNKLK